MLYQCNVLILVDDVILFQDIHKKVENVDCTHWKEPKLIVKVLLHYFCHHPSNIDLLFQLLRALCDRFIPDFQVSIFGYSAIICLKKAVVA